MKKTFTKSEDKAKAVEFLWRKFFAEPSCWWDKRFNKPRQKCPDFIHCTTKEALWVDNWLNPVWVEAHLAKLEQQHGFSAIRAKYSSSPETNTVRSDCSFIQSETSSYTSFGGLKNLCKMDRLHEAISTMELMQQRSTISNNIYFFLLQDCIDKRDVTAGMKVYDLIIKAGVHCNTFVGSQLITMFTVFGSLVEANIVFNYLFEPNVFAWGSIILAQSKLGNPEQSILLYERMKSVDAKVDGHVFVAVLKSCAIITALTQGKAVHVRVLSSGLQIDNCLKNALVHMYARCGCLTDAHRLFDTLLKKDMVTWSAMIGGYAEFGFCEEAMHLITCMHEEGFQPDDVTFTCILKACTRTGAETAGDIIHSYILERGCLDNYSGSTLIDLYSRCGRLHDASKVFNQVTTRGGTLVVYNTMISGYAMHGYLEEALRLFRHIQCTGTQPDNITVLNILSAQFTEENLDCLKEIYEWTFEHGLNSNVMVVSALSDVLSKHGELELASKLFANLMDRDVVTWSSMIGCYSQNGCGMQALNALQQMQQQGSQPNPVTLLYSVKACILMASIDHGRLVHHNVVESGDDLDCFVGSSLIYLYVKCKSLEDALAVFSRLPCRDLVAWNDIIFGYLKLNGSHGVLKLFYKMQSENLKPNHDTFACVLSACSHLGLVDEICNVFQLMESYKIVPTVDHYNCLVDGFGRLGQLRRSEDVLQVMPYSDNTIGWRSLLSNCRTHENFELGRLCFNLVVSNGRLMANIFNCADIVDDSGTEKITTNLSDLWKLSRI